MIAPENQQRMSDRLNARKIITLPASQTPVAEPALVA